MLFSRTYDVERFWCPADGVIGLDQWGFLHDPHVRTEWMGQSDSVPFEYIEDVPVLVLLGEPGTGKSQWFQDSQNIIENIHRRGHEGLWIDLGLYDSASDVVDAVFRNTQYVRWVEGQYRLQLFLDGFDECHFRVDVLPRRFLNELRKQPIERLCLRILCRSSEWPQSLEDGLRNLWHERLHGEPAAVEGKDGKEVLIADVSAESVQVFELAPFRRDDVIRIARGEKTEPESLLHEIQSKELVPFANRPQTLAFLIKMYQNTGRFPANQAELYLEGCRELCREADPGRIDAHLTGNFETDELLATAERLAALTVFCNRHSILRYDNRTDEVGGGDISFREVCHGFEKVNGREVAVREDIVRETLNTGLFSGRPGGRMGWAHQTYAEYLAAVYLCRNSLPIDLIMTLIQHPQWLERKIPPQLTETAAWLSLMNQGLLEKLIEVDPEILLLKRQYTDSGAQHDAQKERLIESLLKLLDEGRLLDHRIYRMPMLGHLQHPRLGDQLRPYISDRTKGFVVRRVAIRIAEENEVHELQDAISEVALDPLDDYLVRQPAAQALLKIASNDVKLNLKPLALGQREDDPDDELKGCALIALWPDLLTAEELFDNLTFPRNPHFFGSYQGIFLRRVLLDGVQASHLPTALRWVQQQQSKQGEYFSFKEIVDDIMRKAFDHLEYPVVLKQFARAALHRLREYEEIVPSDSSRREDSALFADDIKRRRLVQRMLRLTLESNETALLEAHPLSNVVIQRDISWLIELFRSEPEQKTKDILALLIAWHFVPTDTDQFEAVFRLSMESATLAEEMRYKVGPIELESEEAVTMRRRFNRNSRSTLASGGKPKLTSCPEDTVRRHLEEIEKGSLQRFATLAWQMIEPESHSDRFGSSHTDLTGLKSWHAFGDDTRERIVHAAVAYITHCDPEAGKWVAMAGYIAFACVLQIDRGSMASFGSAVWIKWAPAIVAGASSSVEPQSQALLAEAYARIPEVTISLINRQISYENKSANHLDIVDRLAKCWDKRISQMILDRLSDPVLKPNSIDNLLTALLKHDPNAAVSLATSKLEVPLPARGRGRLMALAAARLLMLHFPEAGWPIVWSAVAGARLFGRRLMSLLAHDAYSRLGPSFDRLAEDVLVTLYIWISREFPIPQEERSTRFLRSPSVHDVEERILRHLQDRGTIESVRALQELCTRLPERAERLRWVLSAAKDRTLAETWTPWRPKEVLGVVQDHQKRLVQSGDQLLQVIIESISRFQKSLHDELPAVRDLWDRQVKRLQSEDSWIPVDERPLSDRIARHLREDLAEKGVVIGREVQIRPSELTDIHVDAITQGTLSDKVELVKAIIEVKGCWNDGLELDMERQLLARYMAENNCDHGLYLIGWFYCDSWDKDDYRSRKPRKEVADMPIEEAKQAFDSQAEALTAQSEKVVRAFVLDARRR